MFRIGGDSDEEEDEDEERRERERERMKKMKKASYGDPSSSPIAKMTAFLEEKVVSFNFAKMTAFLQDEMALSFITSTTFTKVLT